MLPLAAPLFTTKYALRHTHTQEIDLSCGRRLRLRLDQRNGWRPTKCPGNDIVKFIAGVVVASKCVNNSCSCYPKEEEEEIGRSINTTSEWVEKKYDNGRQDQWRSICVFFYGGDLKLMMTTWFVVNVADQIRDTTTRMMATTIRITIYTKWIKLSFLV